GVEVAGGRLEGRQHGRRAEPHLDAIPDGVGEVPVVGDEHYLATGHGRTPDSVAAALLAATGQATPHRQGADSSAGIGLEAWATCVANLSHQGTHWIASSDTKIDPLAKAPIEAVVLGISLLRHVIRFLAEKALRNSESFLQRRSCK